MGELGLDTLPSRVLTNLAKGHKRRGKRLARMVLNTVRNYPALQDQHVYAMGCNNTACMVGWVNVFGLNVAPAHLEDEDLEEVAHEFDLGPFAFDEDLGVDPEVQVAAWLLGLRTKGAICDLQYDVYNEFDSEAAISAFCELTGVQDPTKMKEQASA